MLLQEQCLAADVQHLGRCGAQTRAGEANRQVFLLLRAANSAPLPRRGWRPSARQSKLNVQMCLCSKYLSPAGYHLSSWWCLGTFPPKGNEPLLMQCERPALLLLQRMGTQSTYKVSQSAKKSCSANKSVMWAGKSRATSKAGILLQSSGKRNLSGATEAALLSSSSVPCGCQKTSDQILHCCEQIQWKMQTKVGLFTVLPLLLQMCFLTCTQRMVQVRNG